MKELPRTVSALSLRQEFDRAFGELPPPRAEKAVALLAVSVGGDPYALDLGEIRGLAPSRRLWPGLGAAPGYLGLAGLRGAALPVWDLGQLLGYGPAEGPPAWLAMAAGERPWAAAFSAFEGYLSLAPEDMRPHAAGERAQGFASQACLAGGVLRPVLQFTSVLEAIKGRIAR